MIVRNVVVGFEFEGFNFFANRDTTHNYKYLVSSSASVEHLVMHTMDYCIFR